MHLRKSAYSEKSATGSLNIFYKGFVFITCEVLIDDYSQIPLLCMEQVTAFTASSATTAGASLQYGNAMAQMTVETTATKAIVTVQFHIHVNLDQQHYLYI